MVGTPSCTLYIALLAPKHVETLKVAPLVVGTRGGVGAMGGGVLVVGTWDWVGAIKIGVPTLVINT